MEYGSAPFHDEDSDVRDVDTLTVLTAARRAGVTQSAILRWIRNGYLPATPSSDGWQIPAHALENARRAADEGRGTGPVPRRTQPTLAPAPTPIRSSMETRSVEIAETMPAGIEQIGESVVAPLAELIRDQIDVVHDQAEVIGWLQAERARLTEELAELKALDHGQGDVEPEPVADTSEEVIRGEQSDALVSLLWKDSASSAEINGLRVLDNSHTTSIFQTEAAHVPEQSAGFDIQTFDDWFSEETAEPENPAPAEPDQTDRPELRLEDYADPSWFFVPNDFVDFGEPSENVRPAAVLKPIVPRDVNQATTDLDDDEQLRRLIDETERKIAQLWQDEEELRVASPTHEAVESRDTSDSSRGSIWQRLWPNRR